MLHQVNCQRWWGKRKRQGKVTRIRMTGAKGGQAWDNNNNSVTTVMAWLSCCCHHEMAVTAMARWRGQWQWQDGEDDGKMAGKVKWWVRARVRMPGQEQEHKSTMHDIVRYAIVLSPWRLRWVRVKVTVGQEQGGWEWVHCYCVASLVESAAHAQLTKSGNKPIMWVWVFSDHTCTCTHVGYLNPCSCLTGTNMWLMVKYC